MKNVYRPEIDGLRALAVLPVIFYHAGIEIFKGGFVGVDIFFVVSGYLITTIILKDIKEEKFSLINFYQRRARRILPALIIVIALSLPVAIFLLPPIDLQNLSKSIISSLTFWSNFQFTSESGYFAVPGEYKPLLHTWSLSIEEQFYIIYPLILILFFTIKKSLVSFFIFLIFLTSLFFAQWSGNINSKFPFFDENLLFYSQSYLSEFMMPFGRIWELALGAICAFMINSKDKNFIITHIRSSKLLYSEIYSVIGFLLIFFSVFFLSENFPYPSFYSLIPTFGTALLILFCQKKTFVHKVLSNHTLVFIGLISYSAYLFHYPIFSFIKYASINIKSNFYIYIIPLILFISFLNWKFIEKPFRNPKTSIKKLLIFISFSYLILITISFYIYFNNGLDKREKFVLPKNIENSFNLEQKGLKCFNINYIHKKENQEKICKIGNQKREKIDFIVVGDSHIVSYYSMLNDLANRNNKKGLFLGYSGCPPIINIYPLRGDQKERNCFQLNKSIQRIVKEKNIKNLILISRWSYYTDGDNNGKNLAPISLKQSRNITKALSRNAFKKGLNDTLNFYQNKNVFIVEQPPHQDVDPKKVYYRSFNQNFKKFSQNLLNYSVNINQHNNLQSFIKNIFKQAKNDYNNLTLINVDNVFCNKNIKKCFIGNNKHSFYTDLNHLSIEGAKLTMHKFSKYIEKF